MTVWGRALPGAALVLAAAMVPAGVLVASADRPVSVACEGGLCEVCPPVADLVHRVLDESIACLA